MTSRTTAAGRHERQIATVLELDIDKCANTFGVAPCTATGTPCYNCFSTCKDKPNYVRGTVTLRYGLRGQPIPPGVLVRPYIASVDSSPTVIDADKGLAQRSVTRIKLVDEACTDLEDPYRLSRATPAGGGYWARFAARHPNAVGRFARLRRGYVATPWDWTTFQDELYIIDQIAGPDENGGVSITLSDVIKLADRVKYPTPTDGKLQAELVATADVGVAQSGSTSTTIKLRADASAVDDAYNGMEVYVYANTGAGQRRVITDYVGSTRVATVATWSVTPDSTSAYEIGPLSLNVGTDKASQYDSTGYVVLGDEVIRYTSNTTGVLAWPDTTYRAQFGTARDDHSANDQVQRCAVWSDAGPATVIEELLNAAGVADGYIDLTGLAAEITQWLSSGANITACLVKPEGIGSLLGELLRDLNMLAWWDPVAQKVKFRANMPAISSSVATWTDDANLIDKSTRVERLDNQRITQAGIYFGLRSATADERKNSSYLRGALAIDADAQSANEYAAVRQDVTTSRWLSTANATLASSNMSRKLARRRNAPLRIKFKLDPKDEPQVGDLKNLNTARYTGADGQPSTMQIRVIKVDVQPGHLDIEAESTAFGKRYGFIAPNGYPNYTSATEAQRAYAFVATTATGKMSNGDPGYVIP